VTDVRRQNTVHKVLARAAASGDGEQGIATALHALTGLAVAVEDPFGNLRAWGGPHRPERYPKAGARARVVSRSSAQLGTITAALNKSATPGTAWGIDPKANQVVVTISSSAPAGRAATLAATAAKYGPAVRVQRVAQGFEPKVQGGDAILTDTGARCSAGFNTTGGLITAGHCTAGFPNWTVSGGGPLGPSADSQFPGNDFGLISNTGQPASGSVNLYNGTSQPITGAADAANLKKKRLTNETKKTIIELVVQEMVFYN